MGINKGKDEYLIVRQKLITEILKSRENFDNIIGTLYETKDTKSINAVKKVIDELELFSNEVELSETGHKYLEQTPQSSINTKTINKLITFNNSLMDNLKIVTKTGNKISNLLLDEESLDIPFEMKKIKKYVIDARTKYKNSLELIKELK